MVKLPFTWLRAADAPHADLQEQLTSARAAHEAAKEVAAIALAHFDQLADDGALRRLDEADAAESAALQHVARAERLAAAAAAQQVAAARAADERKVERLQAMMTSAALETRRAPLAHEEAALLVQLVEVRAKRLELESQINADERELAALREKLGAPSAYVPFVPLAAPSTVAVARLESLIVSYDRADPRRHIAASLVDEAAPGRWRRPHCSAV